MCFLRMTLTEQKRKANKMYEQYPLYAGFQQGSDTSEESAESVDARTLRNKCLEQLAQGPQTADQVADGLGLDILSIRPRITELKRLGAIFDTGERCPNTRSGKKAAVVAIKEGE